MGYMVREIKFRVWLDNKMCYPGIDFAEIFFDGDIWNEKTDGILMQWTGLKDKMGRDIYEGDITRDIEGLLGVVQFVGKSWVALDKLGWDNLEYPEECEVIGDIFNNPEILNI